MNCTSIPMLIPTSGTANKLMLSPKPTNRANDLLHECPISVSQINVPRTKQCSQKKDRSCKIVTAQGLRDRRVRLSIDIARRFFDLQDSLGFDTASKTLDWLLTKSRTAIKDLQTSSECDAGVTFTGANEDSNNNVVYNKNSKFCTKKKVAENKERRFAHKYSVKSFDNSTAKELRVKARERARERTAVKNSISKLSQVVKLADSESIGLLQPIKSCKTCESELFCFCLPNGIVQCEETVANLGVITKKLKPSTVTADNLQEMNSCRVTVPSTSQEICMESLEE